MIVFLLICIGFKFCTHNKHIGRQQFLSRTCLNTCMYNQLWFCSVFCLNIERSASRFKRQAPKPSKSNRVKQALLQTLMYIIQLSALLHLRIFLSFSEGILHPDQNYLARNMYVICKPWSHNRLFSQNDRILTIIILVNFSNPILVLPCSANTGRPINNSEVNLP